MNQKYMIYMYLLKARTFIALLLVIAFFSVMVPNFLTTSNLLIMTQHVAITGLLAIGMTLVILTGGIDLSVGAVAGICGMVAGALLTNGLPLWNGSVIFFNVPEVILCVALFGVLVGFVNGAVITRFGVAPFICTWHDVCRQRLGAAVQRRQHLSEPQRHGSAGQYRLLHSRLRDADGHLSAYLADDRLPAAGLLADHQNPAGPLYLRNRR